MKVVNAAQMRSIESAADAAGLGYGEMMARAGAATAREAARVAPPDRAFVVLCGPGNNGGDGLVAARRLCEGLGGSGAGSGTEGAGREADGGGVRGGGTNRVRAIVWGRERDDLCRAAETAGVELLDLAAGGAMTSEQRRTAEDWIGSAGVVIDALFGTGLSRPIAGIPAELLGLAADTGAECRRVAVDVPSGLDADTGAVDPLTLRADLTIAFGFPKLGHLFMPGAAVCGRLVVDPIGIPRDLAEHVSVEMITGDMVSAALPARPVDGHKGSFGHALVVAGSMRYTGAAALAAEAAYRAGAGLVTLAIPRAIHSVVAARLREAVFLPLPDDGDAVAPEAAERVAEALERADAVLVGPGLTTGAGAARVLDAVIEAANTAPDGRSAHPSGRREPALVLDADALSALAAAPARLARLPAGTILTPHPGEMARLIAAAPAPGWSAGAPPAGIERLGEARDHAAAWGSVVVLKGANTVVASPDGRAAIIPFATSALATAGTGDVLAGIVAGLRAGGAGAFEAAWSGAWIHGLCGVLAHDALGARATMAGDVLGRVPEALAAVEG